MNFKKNGFNIILIYLLNIISLSEISLIIKGIGSQKILSNLELLPSQIYINGYLQNSSVNMVYELTEEENDIKMIWNMDIKNCDSMFYSLTNIIKVDLSKFDSSKVTIMKNMFTDYISLTSIILDNFDTHLVNNMNSMFYNCKSLTSLNLTSFDTSSVTNMEKMFAYSISLETLNLSNFETTSTTDMSSMFYECRSLLSLDISSFNIENVSDMSNMFSYCNSLLSLDLRNFCESSIKNISVDSMFEEISNEMAICFDENINANIVYEIYKSNPDYINDCSDVCFNELKRLKKYGDKIICKLDCYLYNEDNKFEYNDTCYPSCPIGTHNSTENIYQCEIDKITNLDTNNEVNDSNIITNIDFTMNDKISQKIIITNLSLNEFLNNLNETNKDNPNNKDIMIEYIRKELASGVLDDLLSKTIYEDKIDLLIIEDNVIFQLTSVYNQNNNNYTNISRINLGECENKIIDTYDIKSNESILILKMDYYEDGLKIPIIEYELYNNITKSYLDLIICEKDKINITIPVKIDENNLYLYNSSSNYYNDICYPYTTNNKTDIILSDRREEYLDNNMSLCEANCQYDGYNFDTKESVCECQVKIVFHLISDISFNKQILLNNFIDLKKTTNIYLMTCINLLFSSNGLKKNIGNYILLIIIFFNVILSIIFKIKGFPKLKNIINNIIRENKKNNTKKRNKNIIKKKNIEVYKNNNTNSINKLKNKKKQKFFIIKILLERRKN